MKAKRVLSILLVVLMVIASVPFSASATTPAGEIQGHAEVVGDAPTNGFGTLDFSLQSTVARATVAWLVFSFDNTIIVPYDYSENKPMTDITDGDITSLYCFEPNLTGGFNLTGAKWAVSGNRTAVCVTYNTTDFARGTKIDTKTLIGKFHYKLADGKTSEDMVKNTFKLETVYETGSFLEKLQETTNARAIHLKLKEIPDPLAYADKDVPDTLALDAFTYPGYDRVKLSSMEISSTSTQVTVPVKLLNEGSTATITLSATAKDADGDSMSFPSDAVWGFDGTAPNGVTISGSSSTATLSVAPGASSGTATVKVSSGSVSATKKITIAREAENATLIKLFHGTDEIIGSTESIIIPPASAENANTKTYTAKVYNQYAEEMPNEAQFSFTATDDKVTFNNGTLKVEKGADKNKTYTLTATSGGASKSLTIKLSDLEVDWSVVDSKKKESIVYGTQNSGAFENLPTTGTATAGTQLSGTFEMKNSTEIQSSGEKTITVVFTVTSDGEYKGITVEKDYSVNVTKKPITIKIDDKTKTYGEPNPELTFTVASGSLVGADTNDDLSVTLNCTATVTSPAGTPVAITGSSASANYNVTIQNGILTINKATITGYQTAAPTATILANDANNTADKLKTAANLPATVTVTYAGGTATLPITWANASEKFNVKGGTYTFKGIVPASENFNAYTTPLTATLTVTAVNGTLNTTVPTSVVIAQNTAENATSYADFKLPASIVIDCDNAVAQQTITPTWSVTLNELKSKKVGSKTTVKVTNLPEWLTMSDVTVTVEITDKFPVTVTVGAISNVTYGTEIANPTATQAAIDNGIDSGATFTYNYIGTTASGTAYNSATKPTEAGDYTVTATLVSNTHAGSGSTTFKILPKNLDNSMIGAIASVTYNGKAQEPTLTVTDGSVTLVKDKDFTVAYANNTAVGTATATITGKGNYSGTASKDFTIDPISIALMTVKVEGTAEVEQALLASVEGVETVTFNWFVDGVEINNYTQPYLLLKPEHENKEITVSATASGNYGGTTAVSEAKTIAAATGDVVSLDVPQKAEITASAGNTQVTVKATAESEKPIALYAFKLCDSSDNIIKTVYSLTDSYTFTELTNGTEYHVSAVAFNVNGEGAWSDSESVTPKAPSYSGGGSSAPSDEENTKTLPNGNTVKTEKTNERISIIVKTPTGETIVEISLPAEPGEGKTFTDVKDGSWYKDAVDKATGYGLFNGVSATKFEPKTGMTRGMMAQVLYNLSGKTPYGIGITKFPDTQGWYSDSIDWAAAAGVVNGMPNGKFEPEYEITREQLVVMLYNYARAIGCEGEKVADLSSFPDSEKVANYAKEAMQWAVANKVVSGTTSKNGLLINPKGTATRAEVATMMVHFVEYLK